MDQQLLNTICEQIYRQFPNVSGKRPKVQTRPGDQFLLIFQGNATAADGRKIPQTVRVVTNQAGKILKITTSR